MGRSKQRPGGSSLSLPVCVPTSPGWFRSRFVLRACLINGINNSITITCALYRNPFQTRDAIHKRNELHIFKVLPRRWVAERSFGWFGRSRRLNRDYERQAYTGEIMVYLSMIPLMLARLRRSSFIFQTGSNRLADLNSKFQKAIHDAFADNLLMCARKRALPNAIVFVPYCCR
jgi:hypothetical protein